MIVRPRPHWLRMLFVLRGSILPLILPQLLITTAFALGVTLLHGQVFHWKVPLNFVPFSLIGLTLALFLGFRNNTSYARYWEARMLWGSLLVETRTLARQALTLSTAPAEARVLAHRLAAFVHALRHQLRGTDPSADLGRLLDAGDLARLAGVRAPCSMLLLLAAEWVRDRHAAGELPTAVVPALDAPISRLNAALGGCERLASTPIPFTYAVIIHRTIYLYCVLLPFGLIDAIGPMTPVIVAFISYTFFALEALGAEIEEPFGLASNDLALDAMSVGIEHALRELLGERDLPPAPGPVDYVLT